MNQHDEIERADAELERLLTATFAAEARNRVTDSRPVPPFPRTGRVATVHPVRRRWIGVSLVAATLAAIVVGATVIGDEAMDSRRAPTPAGTSVAPAPTSSSSPTPTTSPTPSTGPSTAPTTGASTPPAAVTKQVTVQGVVLTVPTAWNAVDLVTGSEGDTCLTTATSVVQTAHADNCELHVTVAQLAAGPPAVDKPSVYSDGGICSSSPQTPQQTITADQLVVDGQTAEHRVFTAPCLTQPLEQWTIATAPVVVFLREPPAPDAAGRAEAVAAVQSAVLPGPRSSLRLADHGLLTGLAGSALRIDRVVDRYGAPVLNNNPATYDYPITAETDIRFGDAQGEIVGLDLPKLRELENGPLVIDGVTVPQLSDMTVTVYTDGEHATGVGLGGR